jgi:hypothetical protein
MDKLLWALLFFVSSLNLSAQCTFDTVDDDDFEYTSNINGLISGTVYHLTPKDFKPAHSPTRYCYMNFVNNLPNNTLVMDRYYEVCLNNTYKISAWFNEINGGTSNYTLRMRDMNDSILFSSAQTNTTSSWVQWTSSNFTATTDSVRFQLIYTGGIGNNDLAMDDLVLERCQIDPYVNDSILVCISNSVNLIDSIQYPSGMGGGWSGPSVLLNDSLGTFNASSMTPGEYTYTVSSSTACPDSVGLITVNIASVDTGVSLSDFILTASAVNATYQWIDCANGQPITGETSQSFSPSSNGSYAVVVTENNCADTSACLTVQGIGIEENALADLQLYPNPSNGTVHLEFGQFVEEVRIEIMNELGQSLYNEEVYGQEKIVMDLNQLTGGMYFIRINAHGQETVRVFLKTE